MKDLKVFFEDLATNESLAKKFEGIKKTDDIVALAKEEGYEFTKKEFDAVMLEMVSGGRKMTQDECTAVAETLHALADGVEEGLDIKEIGKKVGKKAIGQAISLFL